MDIGHYITTKCLTPTVQWKPNCCWALPWLILQTVLNLLYAHACTYIHFPFTIIRVVSFLIWNHNIKNMVYKNQVPLKKLLGLCPTEAKKKIGWMLDSKDFSVWPIFWHLNMKKMIRTIVYENRIDKPYTLINILY